MLRTHIGTETVDGTANGDTFSEILAKYHMRSKKLARCCNEAERWAGYNDGQNSDDKLIHVFCQIEEALKKNCMAEA